MIEVLVAAAVLAIGLSAIAAVLVYTSMSSRNGLRKGEVALAGASTIESWAARGYYQLQEGIFDAGTIFNELNVPLYSQRMTVTDAGTQAYRLQLDIGWNDVTLGNSQPVVQTQRYITVVTGDFADAGF